MSTRQEVVLIGVRMDAPAVRAVLDGCLLTDAEMAGGPAAWAGLDDPFAALWEAQEAAVEAAAATTTHTHRHRHHGGGEHHHHHHRAHSDDEEGAINADDL